VLCPYSRVACTAFCDLLLGGTIEGDGATAAPSPSMYSVSILLGHL